MASAAQPLLDELHGVPIEGAAEMYDLTTPERDGPSVVVATLAEGSEALV